MSELAAPVACQILALLLETLLGLRAHVLRILQIARANLNLKLQQGVRAAADVFQLGIAELRPASPEPEESIS